MGELDLYPEIDLDSQQLRGRVCPAGWYAIIVPELLKMHLDMLSEILIDMLTDTLRHMLLGSLIDVLLVTIIIMLLQFQLSIKYSLINLFIWSSSNNMGIPHAHA